MDSIDHRARGIRAQQLLDDEVLAEVLATVEAEAVDGLGEAALADFATLQHHAARLQAARAVRDRLKSLVARSTSTGRTAPDVA